jgi:radical SAM protein with 4Fe4S-binding SPASM domain
VTFWHPEYWNESFNKKAKQFYPAKGFCTFVFNNVTLSANGHISKCCMDLKGATVYADLSKNTLEEIWHSKARKQFLAMMFKNNRKNIQGCNTCSITRTNNDNRYTNIASVLKRQFILPVKRKSYRNAPVSCAADNKVA